MLKIKQWGIRLGNLIRNYPVTSIPIGLFLIFLFLTLYGVSRPAKHDRDFVEHLSRLPHIEMEEGGFSVAPIRNWSYLPEGPLDRQWRELPTGYNYEDLKGMWFLVEPHPGMKAMAHTLVLFEFSDDRLLGLTIEARRETHEKYSAWQGNWGKFELLYVWANARDLVQRRTIHLGKNVEIYPIDLETDDVQSFLQTMLKETQRIEEKPRHYNTLFSNCTNELGKNANIGWHYSFITTGYASKHLHSIGLIENQDAFPVMKQKADMTEFLIRLENASPALPSEAFDRALLAHLRRVFSSSPQNAES